MQTEKIFIREDKSRVKLTVTLNIEQWGSNAGVHWNWYIHYSAPRKRLFVGVFSSSDHDYRKQPFPEGRRKWEEEKYFEYVTPEEVLEVKMDLWQKLKPTL